jgi:hypothetical protein
MDDISSVRNDTGAFTEVIRQRQTWIMSFLCLGMFGSSIGYSFAFGLVLQNQFGRTPPQAAAVTFIGLLLGSLIRPLGGGLADARGGARVDGFGRPHRQSDRRSYDRSGAVKQDLEHYQQIGQRARYRAIGKHRRLTLMG